MTFVPLLDSVRSRLRSPAVVILGSPYSVAELVQATHLDEVVCYQMDLFQAARLREEIAARGLTARVETHPDLWDLEAIFPTAILPIATHGERELKLDLIEQSYQVLQRGGMLISLSEYVRDQLCPRAHKKIFGKCSEAPASKAGSVFWSTRNGDRPRRRHEVTFRAKFGAERGIDFLSWPGVFCYGRFDNGSRALLECAEFGDGDSILDLGCGDGAVGVLAARAAGPNTRVTFVDSNVRATALAEENARRAGLEHYRIHPAARMEGLPENEFDVILANPPYFAGSSIAALFVEQSRPLLKPDGKLYLVTKQINAVAPVVAEVFDHADLFEQRGYHVIRAEK